MNVKLSLALWQRRRAYRKRKLEAVRKAAHKNEPVTNDEANRVHKWERLLKEAESMVARRRKQLDGKHVAAPVKPIVAHTWGWHPGVHDGVDLITEGDDVLYALCDAVVIDARATGWWGLGAKASSGHPISDGDGIIQLRCTTDVGPFRKGMHFGYGHAEKATVRVGQKVKAGQKIGHAGFANAWHVHFMANGGTTTRGVGDRDPWPYVKYALEHDK